MRSAVAVAVAVMALALLSGCNSATSDEARAKTGLSAKELAVARNVAEQYRADVKGTFVGAVGSTADSRSSNADCPSDRVVIVRVVWKDDANFVHGGVLGGPPDGPFKAAVALVDPANQHVCQRSAAYRAVGATARESLVLGTRPVDPTGQFDITAISD